MRVHSKQSMNDIVNRKREGGINKMRKQSRLCACMCCGLGEGNPLLRGQNLRNMAISIKNF